MAGVNDQIVVQFAPELGMIFRGICLKYWEIISSHHFEQKESLVQLTIGLNRPDSLDQGVTGRYEDRVYLLEDDILTAGGVEIDRSVAKFYIPHGVY